MGTVPVSSTSRKMTLLYHIYEQKATINGKNIEITPPEAVDAIVLFLI